MRHLLRITGLLAALTLFAGFAAPALAQDSTPTSGNTGLAGMQEAIARQYAGEFALAPATPAATPASANPHGDIFVVTARIIAFDTPEHAQAAFSESIQSAEDQAKTIGVADSQLTRADIDNLGDKAHAVTLAATRDGVTGYMRFLFVVEGSRLYFLSAIAGTEQGVGVTDDIAKVMVGREPGEAKEAFDPNGASTGGLWGIFPAADDPVLDGLRVVSDQQIAPAS